MLIVVVVTIVVLISFSRSNDSIQQAQSTPSADIKDETVLESSLLIDLLSSLHEHGFTPINLDSMWWVSDDNWSIEIPSESIGLVHEEAYKELLESNSETNVILEKIRSYFDIKGFVKNQANSSQGVVDDSFYDYIEGYQRGGARCLATVNPDIVLYKDEDGKMVSDSNIVVSCATEQAYMSSYEDQIPFLKAMNDRKAVVGIRENNGTEAMTAVHWRRSGAFALFSKKNGYWEMIYRGQDQPSCEVLEKYEFPKDIHDECLQ